MAYDNAYRIGEAIVEYGDDPYQRSIAAALEVGKIITEAVEAKKIQLTRFEQDSLNSAIRTFNKLPDDSSKFIKRSVRRYGRKVEDFDPKNYEL